MIRFCVTKQVQYPDGDLCVEISSGGFDNVNPGQVGSVYKFSLATEAVEQAIELAQAWQEEKGEEEVFIGRGYTHGDTMPFDCEELCEQTYAELRAWAAEHDEALPKCDFCGGVINEEHYSLSGADWSYDKFCSERCAEKAFSREARGEFESRIEQVVENLKPLEKHPLWQTQEYLYVVLEDDDSVSVTDTSVHTAGTAWACWHEGNSLESIARELLESTED